MDNYNFTKGKWITEKFDLEGYDKSILIVSKNDNKQIAEVNFEYLRNDDYVYNALLISKAPEMLDIIEELCENLYFQLDRLGVCGEGDGKGRKADVDSYGGTELLQRAKHLIKEATEL